LNLSKQRIIIGVLLDGKNTCLFHSFDWNRFFCDLMIDMNYLKIMSLEC